MRIGILVDELISGGFQKVAVMETIGFLKIGHNAKLVVLHRTKNTGYGDIIKQNNIDVVYLSDRLPWFLKINFKFPLFAFFSFFHIFYYIFINKYIKENEFDVFITHGTYTAFSSIAIYKRNKIPFISYIHDPICYILKQKYKSSIFKIFLPLLLPLGVFLDKGIIKNSKKVLAYPEMIEILNKIMPVEDKYISIWNGCDPIDSNLIQYKKDNFAIAVTKWDQGKNIELLLDIWERMEKKIPLKIIGNWFPKALKNTFIKKLIEKKLNNDIEVIGPVSEKELSNYYQRAKYLIHPCREAFGMTIIEAAANGCPSIFTSNSGVARLFKKEKYLMVEENNLTDYLNKAEHLLSNNSEEKMYIKSYFNVALDNSWEEHCKKILLFLN